MLQGEEFMRLRTDWACRFHKVPAAVAVVVEVVVVIVVVAVVVVVVLVVTLNPKPV